MPKNQTFNHGVAGSSPAGLTNKIKWLVRIVKKGISAKVRYRYEREFGASTVDGDWCWVCLGSAHGLGGHQEKANAPPCAGAGLRTKKEAIAEESFARLREVLVDACLSEGDWGFYWWAI